MQPVVFSCFRLSWKIHTSGIWGPLPIHWPYSKENETPWCWQNWSHCCPRGTRLCCQTQISVWRPANQMLSGYAEDRVWTKRKDTATGFMDDLTESCISGVFLFIYAVHSKSLSFSLPQICWACVLNKIVCLSERFPSVFDETVPS